MNSSQTTDLLGISLVTTAGAESPSLSDTGDQSEIVDYNSYSSGPDAVSSMVPWVTEGIVFTTVGALITIIAIGGLFTNVIVMTVFRRQGIMAESSTVSLFALAMADFTLQLSHIGTVAGKVLGYYVGPGDIDVDPAAVYEVIPFRMKVITLHLIAWLTAYLSFERCISVMFPFHVKRIFSPKIALTIVICIFIGTMLSYMSSITLFAFTTEIRFNRTYVTIYMTSIFSKSFRNYVKLLCYIGLRYLAITIVVLSNVIILKKVGLSKKWRNPNPVSTSSSKECSNDEKSDKSKSAVNKEDRLTKQLVIISGMFLICTLPDTIVTLMTQTEMAVLDYSARVVWYGGNMFFESINSSINIFVYYSMSTKFKKEFRELFGMRQK